jgi:hypothetical protein
MSYNIPNTTPVASSLCSDEANKLLSPKRTITFETTHGPLLYRTTLSCSTTVATPSSPELHDPATSPPTDKIAQTRTDSVASHDNLEVESDADVSAAANEGSSDESLPDGSSDDYSKTHWEIIKFMLWRDRGWLTEPWSSMFPDHVPGTPVFLDEKDTVIFKSS